jgi:(2R)-3-sulfolactate dehydrogenase (NADP+)
MSRIVTLEALRRLAARALENAGTASDNARAVADALVAADADGIASHGVSRVPFYADQARTGKVNGRAVPELQVRARAAVRVDARDGFAYPAIRAGLDRAITLGAETGVVGVVIANSHHAGAGGYHVEHAANAGCLAIGFSNTPSAMAPWGGSRATFGTNPIAFACPREGKPPMAVDLSLSVVARGRIMQASQKGEAIPEGWALDAAGEATTDAKAALGGSMVPLGGAKGAALALMVELLTGALSGSHLAFEASSFFDAEGPPPRIGQSFLLIDPAVFAGDGFAARAERLFAEMTAQPGVRLPGARRLANRARAHAEGVGIPEKLYEDLERRAASG